MSFKQAVCVLIPALPPKTLQDFSHTAYLAVSRRNKTSQWGMPGGKVDPGETSLEAIIREIKEEVGLVVPANELVPVYSALCHGKGPEDSYWTTTYFWIRDGMLEQAVEVEEGLTFKFMPGQELTAPEHSPFFAYNVQALAAYRKYVLG